jgi:hypothetical protein
MYAQEELHNRFCGICALQHPMALKHAHSESWGSPAELSGMSSHIFRRSEVADTASRMAFHRRTVMQDREKAWLFLSQLITEIRVMQLGLFDRGDALFHDPGRIFLI